MMTLLSAESSCRVCPLWTKADNGRLRPAGDGSPATRFISGRNSELLATELMEKYVYTQPGELTWSLALTLSPAVQPRIVDSG